MIMKHTMSMLRTLVAVLAFFTFGSVTAHAKTAHDRNVVKKEFRITNTATKSNNFNYDAKPSKRTKKRKYTKRRRSYKKRRTSTKRTYRSKRRSTKRRSKRRYGKKRRTTKRRYGKKRRTTKRRYGKKRRYSSKRRRSYRKRRTSYRRSYKKRRRSGRRTAKLNRRYRGGRGNLRAILRRVKPAGLPYRLAAAVVTVESAWKVRARGSSGEKGLMQLMPGTARLMGGGNMYDPATNLRAGTKYLHWCYKRAKRSVPATIGCYNRGPGKMWQWSGNPITRRYVAKVRRLM